MPVDACGELGNSPAFADGRMRGASGSEEAFLSGVCKPPSLE